MVLAGYTFDNSI